MEQQEFVRWISDYGMISEMVKIYSYQQISEAAAAFLKMDPEVLERYPMGGCVQGMQDGVYRSVLGDLINNIEHFDQVFSYLSDEESRMVFYDLVAYRIVPMPCFLEEACDVGKSLDADIGEGITFVKIGIEEAAISALLGAKRRIREDFPGLAVCTHHMMSDMWEIPRLIDEIHPGYRFFIRHHLHSGDPETEIGRASCRERV